MNKKKFNTVKKTLKGFMQDESGFVSKDNILKIGMGTIASMGIMSSAYPDEWWNEYDITAGSDLPAGHPSRAWLNTTFSGIHQNFTSFQQVGAPYSNCARLIHSNGTLAALSHHSHDFHLHAWGEIEEKGWHALVDYPNNADIHPVTCPIPPYAP